MVSKDVCVGKCGWMCAECVQNVWYVVVVVRVGVVCGGVGLSVSRWVWLSGSVCGSVAVLGRCK